MLPFSDDIDTFPLIWEPVTFPSELRIENLPDRFSRSIFPQLFDILILP